MMKGSFFATRFCLLSGLSLLLLVKQSDCVQLGHSNPPAITSVLFLISVLHAVQFVDAGVNIDVGVPSPAPTPAPTTKAPTAVPSKAPSSFPSGKPSAFPSGKPSKSPSRQPTRVPSKQPSHSPSRSPSSGPSLNPSIPPSGAPSQSPTLSRVPSGSPSISDPPSQSPSSHPSNSPTISSQPTNSPTRNLLPLIPGIDIPDALCLLVPVPYLWCYLFAGGEKDNYNRDSLPISDEQQDLWERMFTAAEGALFPGAALGAEEAIEVEP